MASNKIRALNSAVLFRIGGVQIGGITSGGFDESLATEDVTTVYSVATEKECTDYTFSGSCELNIEVGDEGQAALATAIRNKAIVQVAYKEGTTTVVGDCIITKWSRKFTANKYVTGSLSFEGTGALTA